MSTTLEVRFRCMCLFVTDEQTGHTHVLMPSTAACGHGAHTGHDGETAIGETGAAGGEGAPAHGHVARHVVKLVYPLEGGTLDAEGETRVPSGHKQDDDLEGWSLVLPGIEGGDPPAVVKNESVILPDLSDVTSFKIDRALFNGTNDPRLAARVTLTAGGIADKQAVADWTFIDEGKEVRLAQEVLWRIENLPDEPLRLKKVRLGAGGDPAPGDVQHYPEIHADESGVIRLRVIHTMPDDFPMPKNRDGHEAAKHFAAFYSLFSQRAVPRLPKFIRKDMVGTAGCLGAMAK
jgi:hypothetical protein